MAGEKSPARHLKHIARPCRHEWVLNVVRGTGHRHTCGEQLRDPCETARWQPGGVAALQEQVGGRQGDHTDTGRGKASAEPLRLVERQGGQDRAMAGDHVALEAEPLRALNNLRYVMAASVEMLIEMDVEAPAVACSGIEEEIQEGWWIIGQRGCAAHDINTCLERCLQPQARAVARFRALALVRSATTCSCRRSCHHSRRSSKASTPRIPMVASTLTCERITTVPRVRQAVSVCSARLRISSRAIPCPA